MALPSSFTQTVRDEIARVSKNLGINPDDLAAVISFETGGTFSPNARNPKSTATGLIQFMAGKGGTPGRYYGLTRDQFGSLPVGRQMDYVQRYLKEAGVKPGTDLAGIYQAVAGSGYRRGTAAYDLNKSWDSNGDGVVSAGEQTKNAGFQAHVRSYFGANPGTALAPGARWVPPTAKEIQDGISKGLPLAPYLVPDAVSGNALEAGNPGISTITEAEAAKLSGAESFLGFSFASLKGGAVSVAGAVVALLLLLGGVVLLGLSFNAPEAA